MEYDEGILLLLITNESILQFQKFKNSFSSSVSGGEMQAHVFIILLVCSESKISFIFPNIIFPVLIESLNVIYIFFIII